MIIKVVLPTTEMAVETADYPEHYLKHLINIVRAARYNAALSKDDRRLARDLDDYATYLKDHYGEPSITA